MKKVYKIEILRNYHKILVHIGLRIDLQLYTAKSKVMYFSKKVIKSPPTITYNDEPLEYVQSFNYLGLNFNSKCSFCRIIRQIMQPS